MAALGLDRRFFGLAMMEYWGRFAISGIKSLLIVLLADQVLAGDLSQVAGATTLHHVFDRWFGPLPTAGIASQIYGYANALLYVSIPLGGLLGDLVVGRRGAVYLGGGAMLGGLLLMLHATSFLPGLLVFVVGAGTLKGNLSAQVGPLFADETTRQRGYAVYLGFVNAGAICGPFVCGTLAVVTGWSSAIVAAAAALAIGLVGYAMMEPATASRAPPAGRRSVAARRQDWRGAHAVLTAAILGVYCCYSAYEQIGDAFLLWARGTIHLRLAGWSMPVSWFLSFDGAITLGLVVLWQAWLPRLARHGIVIDAVTQILLGSLACGLGYALLTLAALQPHGTLSPLWALAYLVMIDSAVVLIWPSGLSLVSALAPPRLTGFWMGLFYLHGFFASLWVGISGSFLGRMPDTLFWLLQAGVAGAGAVLAIAAKLLQRRPALTRWTVASPEPRLAELVSASRPLTVPASGTGGI